MKKLLLFLMSVSVMLSSLTAVAEEYEEITVSEPEYDIVYPTGGISPEICTAEAIEDVEEPVRLFSNTSGETIYEYIERQCMNHVEEIDVSSYNVYLDNIGDIYFTVVYTCPKAMLISSYDYSYYEESKKVVTLRPRYLFATKEESDEARENMNKVINEYLALSEPYSGEIEKILFLHDEMVKRCSYDSEAAENVGTEAENVDIKWEAFNAYGIFVKETAVCQGYAIAFLELLNRIGIENRLCRSDKAYHIWNQVKIDDKWYNIDVTHDDPIYGDPSTGESYELEEAKHRNFLVSDNTLINNGGHADNRSDWEVYGGTLTECTDTEFESKYMFNYSSPFTIGYSDNEFYFNTDIGANNGETVTIYNVVFHSPQLRTPGMLLSYDFKMGTSDYFVACPLCDNIDDVKMYTSYFKDGVFCKTLSKSKGSCDRIGFVQFNKGEEGLDTKIFFWNNATQAPYSYVYNVK
ncbi:MAG: hypothetical protein SOZ34_00665 [Clostridia bacterium]|nr:hypothetical protein [Clostridia bacterium]